MLDAVAANQNKLNQALVTLTDAQISQHQRGREMDQRNERLVSGIGELVREMRERRN
jgi:hypothetical protein